MNAKSVASKLIPDLLAFFVMGFVDLVGIAANYIKTDFDLSDTLANLLPSMVFFWFLVLSVPTGLLMNRIGRRRTVVLSLAITSVALLVPLFGYSFPLMMVSFCLLGVGNTLIQVSINPLVSNIVTGDKLASTLTFGQFVKALASLSAPLIAGWAATKFGDWKLLFPVFMGVSILSTLFLGLTRIKEDFEPGGGSTFGECFSLLGNGLILFSFIGIMCHVGIDVGVNTTAPKILIERLGIPLEEAGYATVFYFLFRTIGCFTGTFALARFSSRIIFRISVGLMAFSMLGLLLFDSKPMIYLSIALVGLGNSNIFPVILSGAMLSMPGKRNEISGLMIMGLVGGTVFPLLMGLLSDALHAQSGAVAVLAAGVVYLAFFAPKIKN